MTITAGSRIESVDILRGIAVLGILVLNIYAFGYGLDGSGPRDFPLMVSQTPFDIQLHQVLSIVMEGKMRGIFSLLFGVTAMIIISKQEQQSDGLTAADVYYRRLIWLFVFGLINAFVLLWWGDILYSYALCGLFLYPLRKASVKLLMALSLLMMLGYSGRMIIRYQETSTQYKSYQEATAKLTQGDTLTVTEKAAKEKWEARTKEVSPEEIKKYKDEKVGSYGTLFINNLDEAQLIESTYFYRFLFFDCMFMILVGLILYKVHFFDPAFPTSKLVITTVIGYTIGLPLILYTQLTYYHGGYHPLDQLIFHMVYPFERLFMTFGHVGLLLLVFRLRFMAGIGRWLANTGKMAFTNYLMQSILCLFIFSGFGLGMFAKLSLSELMLVVLAIWVFEIVASQIWLRYFVMGPFEWVWRSLTYWKRLPLKRTNDAGA